MLNRYDSNFKSVVKREDLLTKVKVNRANHHAAFIDAQADFASLFRKELKYITQAAKQGKYVLQFKVSQPVSYLREYDRAIAMLEMDTSETITLDQTLFAQLVLDEWDWKQSFETLVSTYKSQLR